MSLAPLRRPSIARALLGAAALLSLAAAPVLATNGGSYTGTGFDISYPQCSGSTYTPGINGTFGIVGVNGGRPFSGNGCFGPEFDYAFSNGGASIYMNTKAPIGKTATGTNTSTPNTTCGKDKVCQAHNYGWNAAKDAYARAGSRKASVWWLDVETANSWSANPAINVASIQGASDYLLTQSTGIASVGIYSTAGMWKSITGSTQYPNGYQNSAWPVWDATPGHTCSSTSFTGGQIWLLQTGTSSAGNTDSAC